MEHMDLKDTMEQVDWGDYKLISEGRDSPLCVIGRLDGKTSITTSSRI